MKLTIKNKVYRGREREQKDDSFSQEMWCAENVGRKKVIHERSKSLSNMIETDLY